MISADIITALGAVATIAGGGVAFVWGKVGERFRRIEDRLDECHEREVAGQERRAVQLTVIELLWQEVERHVKDSPVLNRARELLNDLKKLNERS